MLPLTDDSMLDFMPDVDGEFAPTVREPWRSGELHRWWHGPHIQKMAHAQDIGGAQLEW